MESRNGAAAGWLDRVGDGNDGGKRSVNGGIERALAFIAQLAGIAGKVVD